MILIQDASQGPNMDKPLRIIGDPYKVQVWPFSPFLFSPVSIPYFVVSSLLLPVVPLTSRLRFWRSGSVSVLSLSSKRVKWWRRFCESGIIPASTEMTSALEWVEESRWVIGLIVYIVACLPFEMWVWRRLVLIGQVPVPRHSVGVVIGRSGEMIKKIQNDAGVRIQFKPGLFGLSGSD